jgi:CheY-like chemotaxis protein
MAAKILVVEDDEAMRDLLQLHLSSAGYSVEVAAALRADASLPRMPVIFLSSYAEGEGRARELGVVEYLHKPVRLDQLLVAVERHLPRPR